MTNSEIEKIISILTEIKSNRSYWFVRTQGGDYYEYFQRGSYIAIGLYRPMAVGQVVFCGPQKHNLQHKKQTP
jgi:hypothetical protein